MKKLLGLHLFVFFYLLGFSQDYYSDFKTALNNGDTTAQIKILTEWEKISQNNPELYTSYFNYYFLNSFY